MPITPVDYTANTVEEFVATVNSIIDVVNFAVTANSDANGAATTGNLFVYGIAGANTLVAWNSIRGGNVQTSNTLWVSSNLAVNNSFIIYAGNSTVNTVVNSTAYVVANSTASSVLTVSTIGFGNSTVNSALSSTTLVLQNSTVTFTLSKPSAAQVAAGNYYLNANGQYVEIVTSADDSQANVTTTGTTAQLVDSFSPSLYRAVEYLASVVDNVANGHQLSKLMVMHQGSTSDALISEFGVIQSNGNQGTFTANANSTMIRLWITPVSANATVRVHRTRVNA